VKRTRRGVDHRYPVTRGSGEMKIELMRRHEELKTRIRCVSQP
jgi:hypothetical protein